MPNKKLIQKKLSEVLKQLEFIKRIAQMSEIELFGKEENYYFAERVMERLIGSAIDINMHILADAGKEVADNYYDSFIALAKLKVLPLVFAKKIAPSTSLRNIIVYEYQKIDSGKFYEALKIARKEYKKYAEHIQKYLA